MLRFCNHCNTDKPLSEFREFKPGKYRRQCLDCQREAQRAFSRDYARRKREAEKLEREAKKLEEIEAGKGRLLIGQMTQSQFREFLNRILDDRKVDIEDLLS